IAFAHIERRGGRVAAMLLVITMTLSVIAPLGARGWGVAPAPATGDSALVSGLRAAADGGRIILVMFDGASLDVLLPAVAEGRLPNFGRVLDQGAVLHLATLRPTQPEPVWSAAATGRGPVPTGRRPPATYRARPDDPALTLLPDYCFAQALVRFRFLLETPHDSRSLAAR